MVVKFTGFHIAQVSMDASLAATLHLQGVTDADVQARHQVVRCEIMLEAGSASYPQENGEIYSQSSLAGVAVVAIVDNVKAKIAYDLFSVALAGSIGLAQSTLTTTFMGVTNAGDVATPPPPGVLQQPDGFTLLTDKLQGILTWMVKNSSKIAPAATTTPMGRIAEDRVETAHSIVFAMRQVANGKSLIDALKVMPPAFDSNVVRSVYALKAGGATDTTPPAAAQSSAANTWTHF